MGNIKLLSIESCPDKDYGETIVQYQADNVVSFAFSNIPLNVALPCPETILGELQKDVEARERRPLWNTLSEHLLNAVLFNPFDMHFVEYDDEEWPEGMEDQLWDVRSPERVLALLHVAKTMLS